MNINAKGWIWFRQLGYRLTGMEPVSGCDGGNDSIWFLYCEILLRLVRLTYRLITLASAHVNAFHGMVYSKCLIIISDSFAIVLFMPLVHFTAVMVRVRQLLISVHSMRKISITFNQRGPIGDGVVVLA